MKVSVADAKNKLPELIKAVENGKRVTICRRGRPVADLVRSTAPRRKKIELGFFRNEKFVLDPDWWKPMSEDELNAFLEGRL